MKLQYQLQIAFTALLLLIMTIAGFVIYSLILNLLIQDEERQLEQKGELLVKFLTEVDGNPQNIWEFSNFLEEQDLQLILYDPNLNQVSYSTMPVQVVQGFIDNNNFTDDREGLWEYGNNKFVTSKILFYPSSVNLELVLLTPLKDLQAVQQNFFIRLFIVFLVGGIAAISLSYFLTNKLVTPLSRLQKQLKKIEKRKFDEMERVKATGEIKEVEQSVFDMAKELERYMKSQQTFFQNASHELKTPLMTIQGYAEGIKDNVFDEKQNEQGLELMVIEVKRLKKIINEMILLAKLDSEQSLYEKKITDTSELIMQVKERVQLLASEQNIKLITDVEPNITLFIDEEKMLRALLNITFNGIRYAKSKVRIAVKKADSVVTMTIEDDGEGIPEDILPHLFHRFVKGKQGETGLGLAIARAIVEQSGGSITIAKSELGGAMFILTF